MSEARKSRTVSLPVELITDIECDSVRKGRPIKDIITDVLRAAIPHYRLVADEPPGGCLPSRRAKAK